MLLIDSSAIIRFVSKEPGWENLKEYVLDSFTINLAIPELGSALRKKISKGQIGLEKALEIISEYTENTVLLDQNKYVQQALEIAVRHNLSIYDSLFIAVASEDGYGLVTCDEDQSKIARKLGVDTTCLK